MIFDLTVRDIEGREVPLVQFRGKVLLIVNTATKCGLTPQYEALEALYQEYHDRGFEVLDFPCNQFLQQAPGSDDEINDFCTTNYHTTFPRFAKVEVNGEAASPLYAYLKQEQPRDIANEETPEFLEKLSSLNQSFPGAELKWNFTKFLVDRDGNVVARYAPNCAPETLREKIEALL